MSPPTWQYCDVTTSTGEYSCLQVGVSDKQTNADPFPFVVRSTTCLVHDIIVMDPHNDDITNAMFVRLTCCFPESCPSTSSRSTCPQWWSWLSPGSRSGLTTSRWGTQPMRCRLHNIPLCRPRPGWTSAWPPSWPSTPPWPASSPHCRQWPTPRSEQTESS